MEIKGPGLGFWDREKGSPGQRKYLPVVGIPCRLGGEYGTGHSEAHRWSHEPPSTPRMYREAILAKPCLGPAVGGAGLVSKILGPAGCHLFGETAVRLREVKGLAQTPPEEGGWERRPRQGRCCLR